MTAKKAETLPKGIDQDLILKLRMQKILSSLGFYSRIGVKLTAGQSSDSERPGRQLKYFELTDIDVLGIKINADFSISYVVADCTTRSGVSPVNRAFWLRGVMEYFGANRAYILLTKDIPEYQKIIAANMEITLLDEMNLRRLEETYIQSMAIADAEEKASLISSLDAYRYSRNITQLPNELKPVLTYWDQGFWIDKPERRLFKTISIVQNHKQFFRTDQKFHRVLFFEVFTLFSISILELCSYLFRHSPTDFRATASTYLFGGAAAVAARRTFLSELQNLVESLSNQKNMFLDDDLSQRFKLEPHYMDLLLDRAIRIVNKPREAQDILLYLQSIMLNRVLRNNGPTLSEVFGTSYSDITYKFVRDLAQFFVEVTEVDRSIIQPIFDQKFM